MHAPERESRTKASSMQLTVVTTGNHKHSLKQLRFTKGDYVQVVGAEWKDQLGMLGAVGRIQARTCHDWYLVEFSDGDEGMSGPHLAKVNPSAVAFNRHATHGINWPLTNRKPERAFPPIDSLVRVIALPPAELEAEEDDGIACSIGAVGYVTGYIPGAVQVDFLDAFLYFAPEHLEDAKGEGRTNVCLEAVKAGSERAASVIADEFTTLEALPGQDGYLEFLKANFHDRWQLITNPQLADAILFPDVLDPSYRHELTYDGQRWLNGMVAVPMELVNLALTNQATVITCYARRE